MTERDVIESDASPPGQRNGSRPGALGMSLSAPFISGGRVYVGTNNETPRDPKQIGDRGVMMVFYVLILLFGVFQLSPRVFVRCAAFAFFGADREEADARADDTEGALGVDGTEDGVMHHLGGRSLRVGAHVEHDEMAFTARHDGGEGRAFGAFHRADLDGTRGDEGLGVAGRDDDVDFASLEHLKGDHHGGITLRLEHGHRGVVRSHDAGGVAETDAAVLQRTMLNREHA